MSKLKVTTLATADDLYSVPAETLARGACRAWVNFDGTITPPTIRESFNVSSVVRNGTGDYTVNFTNAMVDVNYLVTINVGGSVASNTETMSAIQSTTSSAARVISKGVSSFVNRTIINVAIFR